MSFRISNDLELSRKSLFLINFNSDINVKSRVTLAKLGVSILGYVPENSLLVRIPLDKFEDTLARQLASLLRLDHKDVIDRKMKVINAIKD